MSLRTGLDAITRENQKTAVVAESTPARHWFPRFKLMPRAGKRLIDKEHNRFIANMRVRLRKCETGYCIWIGVVDYWLYTFTVFVRVIVMCVRPCKELQVCKPKFPKITANQTSHNTKLMNTESCIYASWFAVQTPDKSSAISTFSGLKSIPLGLTTDKYASPSSFDFAASNTAYSYRIPQLDNRRKHGSLIIANGTNWAMPHMDTGLVRMRPLPPDFSRLGLGNLTVSQHSCTKRMLQLNFFMIGRRIKILRIVEALFSPARIDTGQVFTIGGRDKRHRVQYQKARAVFRLSQTINLWETQLTLKNLCRSMRNGGVTRKKRGAEKGYSETLVNWFVEETGRLWMSPQLQSTSLDKPPEVFPCTQTKAIRFRFSLAHVNRILYRDFDSNARQKT
ncbi:hypothetical protein CLF_100136 [Clonorchis sinensis]|uniref:Uncharacterized protein n=1 Tax=Clonorchis sinensis TaxID=79923 RepID=G7Y2R8_CLOSI|nr:hypothetical protein CLF_100136 [Clonorchis sinensis]